MESKKCFTCNIEKPLNQYDIDRMKYQLKSDKGTCKVCRECNVNKALKTLSIIRYNFEIMKFEVINFDNTDGVLNYFNEK
jgi:predicted metal-binding protein